VLPWNEQLPALPAYLVIKLEPGSGDHFVLRREMTSPSQGVSFPVYVLRSFRNDSGTTGSERDNHTPIPCDRLRMMKKYGAPFLKRTAAKRCHPLSLCSANATRVRHISTRAVSSPSSAKNTLRTISTEVRGGDLNPAPTSKTEKKNPCGS
jgi:hypothetical protein